MGISRLAAALCLFATLPLVVPSQAWAVPGEPGGGEPRAGDEPVQPVDPEGKAVAPEEPPPKPYTPNAVIAGDDEVTLRDGGMLRGTVVEIVPADHVSMLVAGETEPRSIPWEQIAEVQRGKFAPATQPPKGPRPGHPIVHLSLSREAPVVLHEIQSRTLRGGLGGPTADTTVREVCQAPCDRVIDASAGQEFYVTGKRIPKSRPFTLVEYGDAVDVEVKPGRRGMLGAGWALGTLGAVAMVAGGTMLVLSDDNDDVRLGGGITMGIGIPVLAVGIALGVVGRTRLQVKRAGAKKRAKRTARRKAKRAARGL